MYTNLNNFKGKENNSPSQCRFRYLRGWLSVDGCHSSHVLVTQVDFYFHRAISYLPFKRVPQNLLNFTDLIIIQQYVQNAGLVDSITPTASTHSLLGLIFCQMTTSILSEVGVSRKCESQILTFNFQASPNSWQSGFGLDFVPH